MGLFSMTLEETQPLGESPRGLDLDSELSDTGPSALDERVEVGVG